MAEIVCVDMLEAGKLIRTCEMRSSCWDCVLNDICSGGNTDAGALRRIETVIRIAEKGLVKAENGLLKRGQAEERTEAETDKREHSFA